MISGFAAPPLSQDSQTDVKIKPTTLNYRHKKVEERGDARRGNAGPIKITRAWNIHKSERESSPDRSGEGGAGRRAEERQEEEEGGSGDPVDRNANDSVGRPRGREDGGEVSRT